MMFITVMILNLHMRSQDKMSLSQLPMSCRM